MNRRRFYPRKRPGAFTCKRLLTANVRRGTRNGRSPLSGRWSIYFRDFSRHLVQRFFNMSFFRRDHGSIFPRPDAAYTVVYTTQLVNKLNEKSILSNTHTHTQVIITAAWSHARSCAPHESRITNANEIARHTRRFRTGRFLMLGIPIEHPRYGRLRGNGRLLVRLIRGNR